MPDFTQGNKFNKDANFSSIKFGADTHLLETELNEMQEIQRERLRSFLSIHVGDGLYGIGTYSYIDPSFAISNEVALVNGNLIKISSLKIDVAEGDSIYLKVKEKEVTFEDTLKKYGNEQETVVIENQMYDVRVNQETSRRIVESYDLSIDTLEENCSYLKLGTITDGEFVLEVSTIKTGSISNEERAYWDAKAEVSYIDNQIALVTATGIPKLVTYPYDIVTTTEGQKEFEIPLVTFSKDTDTVMVFANTTMLPQSAYSIVDAVGEGKGKVVLSAGRELGDLISIWILKNVPLGEDGSVNGRVIALNSIPQDRVIGLGERPYLSLENKTYFIDYTLGNDLNDGTTQETAFKTFEKVMSLLPRTIMHEYDIRIIGDYPLNITIQDINLVGTPRPSLFIRGISSNYSSGIIRNLFIDGVRGTGGYAYHSNLMIEYLTINHIEISNSQLRMWNSLLKGGYPRGVEGLTEYHSCISIYNSNLYVYNSVFQEGSIPTNGIIARLSRVSSISNTGNLSGRYIVSEGASTVAIYDTTPTALTANSSIGGIITTGNIGGIHSQGSNANGEWIRFEDGTQICHKTDITVNNGEYVTANTNYYIVVTFPATFTENPNMNASINFVSNNYDYQSFINPYSNLAINGVICIRPSVANIIRASYLAIGRWK